MKLSLIFISIFLLCQNGFGFRLPSPLDYYNYSRRTITTTEPNETQAQLQEILEIINDGLQEIKNIPIDFTQENVGVNSLTSTLPSLTINRIQ